MIRFCATIVLVLIALANPAIAQQESDYSSLIERLEHPLWTARQDAALALGASGPAAATAIQALTRALDDVDVQVRRAAVQALAEVGIGSEAAVPGLVTALADDDWVVRRRAALAFEAVPGAGAIDAIRELLQNESADVRTSAALAASGLAPHSIDALPELVDALAADDWQLRAAAAHALGALGPGAEDALPALAHALRDRDWGVAEQVVEALSTIGKPAVPVLVDALGDPALPVRWGAVRALGRIGADAETAVPAIAGLLDDPAIQARWAAAKSLWAMGRAAADATPELVAALDDKDWVVRWSASRALGAVVAEPHLESAVTALAAGLQDRDSRVCEAAAFALEEIGPDAVSALPPLSRAATETGLVEIEDETLRPCQIIDVGPAAEELLMASGWTVRWAAVRALGVVGKGRASAIEPLAAALADEQWQVRGVAALALGEFGAPASTALAALEVARDDEIEAVRDAAAIAIAGVTGRAEETEQ